MSYGIFYQVGARKVWLKTAKTAYVLYNGLETNVVQYGLLISILSTIVEVTHTGTHTNI